MVRWGQIQTWEIVHKVTATEQANAVVELIKDLEFRKTIRILYLRGINTGDPAGSYTHIGKIGVGAYLTENEKIALKEGFQNKFVGITFVGPLVIDCRKLYADFHSILQNEELRFKYAYQEKLE